MRSKLLSFPIKFQIAIVVGLTVLTAFVVATVCGMFFDVDHLKANTDLIAAVYQVMGTIYAILLTFTLWGVWQAYTEAGLSIQKEVYAMLDLVHIIEVTPQWAKYNIRDVALEYSENVVHQEWPSLKNITSEIINIREQKHAGCYKFVQIVQSIEPEGSRELTVYSHALGLLENWLDARRSRLLGARGNSAKALWPLLLTGALVLFAFHGLFVAETLGIWITLLGGTALVIGITFYLIFTLDCPFAGYPSVDSEPFCLAIGLLKHKEIN
jgi:hypothetical protein